MSDYGLVSQDNKSSTKPIVTQIYVAIRRYWATMSLSVIEYEV